MTMKCLKPGCKEDAETGSNYCERHSPGGMTRQQLKEQDKQSRDQGC